MKKLSLYIRMRLAARKILLSHLAPSVGPTKEASPLIHMPIDPINE